MNNVARSGRALILGIVVVAASLTISQAAVAAPHRPSVPKEIQVTGGNKVFLVGHTRDGVQIYRCNGTAWTFVGPRADLVDDDGRLIATHFAGPTWRATDGSAVVGELPPAGSVIVDPTAIPWLLLNAAPAATPGLLADTTVIQRVATTGGLAPAAAACTPSNMDTVVEVPYAADYYFWQKPGQRKKPGA